MHKFTNNTPRLYILCLILMLAAWASAADRKDISLPKGYSTLADFPFVIVADDTQQGDLQLSDSLFNSIATGVQFKQGSSDIDKGSAFFSMYYTKLLPVLLRERYVLTKLFIRGAASPEGTYENNRKLGIQRTDNLLKMLQDDLRQNGQQNMTISSQAITEDYRYLVDLMQAADDKDTQVVRRLFDDCGWDVQCCKQALQKLRGGSVWSRLYSEYFPRLRSSRIVLCVKRAKPVTAVAQPQVTYIGGRKDTIYIRDTIVVVRTVHNIDGQPLLYDTRGRFISSQFTAKDSIEHHPLLALKTNLLFDAVTALNASVEVPLGKRFSVSAEVVWPWWVDKHNQWCLQMGNVGLEGRYYFRPWNRHSTNADWVRNNDRPLQGLFLGLHADACYYDFEWKGSGKQGEAISAGVTFGYQKRISRYCNLEFSLGLGGAAHRYRSYESSEDEQHLWKQSTYTNRWYFGPTKAKISLVWLLYKNCKDKCKKGGKK